MNFKKICRVCTGNNSTMVSIFESYYFSAASANNCDIFKVITDCASVQIQKLDGFPEQICCRCLDHLCQAYSFKKLCEHSDYKFRNGLIVSDLIEIKDEQRNEEITTKNKPDNSDNHKAGIDEEQLDTASIFNAVLESMECEAPTDAQCTENETSGKLRLVNLGKISAGNAGTDLTYNCKVCGTSLATRKCLDQHMKIHTEQEYGGQTICQFRSDLIANEVMEFKSEFLENDTIINYGDIRKENIAGKSNETDFEVIEVKEESESDFENEFGPQAASSSDNGLPEKSKARYEIVYQKIMSWRAKNNVHSFSEDVLMTYFTEITKEFKPSSLWAIYSMLKSMIIVKDNVDIGNYQKLKEYLKGQSKGFKSKKTKTLNAREILKFIQIAPISKYLFMKVVLIIGISGGCRKQELKNLKITDVEDTGKHLVIKIPDTMTKKLRSFVVSGIFYKICKQYLVIRQQINDCCITQFFLHYADGKCIRKVVGLNKLGNVPKQIAEYLKLPNPGEYTGHCFRRTSATVLVEAEGDLMPLKILGT